MKPCPPETKLPDLGRPYKTSIAVTSHLLVSFCGWVLMSSNRFPPILGLLSIYTNNEQSERQNLSFSSAVMLNQYEQFEIKSFFSVHSLSWTYTAHSLLLRQTQAPCLRHVVWALDNAHAGWTFVFPSEDWTFCRKLKKKRPEGILTLLSPSMASLSACRSTKSMGICWSSFMFIPS